MVDASDIRQFVPHAGLMCLLDEVCGRGENWLEARVTIRPDSLFCHDDGVGAWVGMEYMAQAIAAFGGVRARQKGEPVKIGFLVGTRKYACRWPSFPVGSTLQVRVDQEYEADNGLSVFQCRLRCADEELASAAITVFQPTDPQAFLKGETT